MGGIDDDSAYGLVVDSFGAAYVTGKTASFDFPTTAGAYSTLFGGGTDAYNSPAQLVVKLKAMNPWFSIKPKRGSSTGEWDEFTIEVDPTGLSAGVHQGIIEVISKDTVDSPVEISIVLNVVRSN